MRAKSSLNSLLTLFFVLALTLIVISTCSRKSPVISSGDQGCPILLKISFADASLSDLISRVVLTITLPETDSLIRRNLLLRNGKISSSIEVPVGRDRIFKLEALDQNGVVIYRGADTVTVVGESTTDVVIILIPVTEVFLLKLNPVYQTASRFDVCSLDVNLYNAKNLFGISFRVEFDPKVVRSVVALAGDFLGDSTIFFVKVDTIQGYVAIGYSRTEDNGTGVTGSGTLARLFMSFEPIFPGSEVDSSLVSILFNRQTLAFYRPDGESQDMRDSVYIHDAQVLVR